MAVHVRYNRTAFDKFMLPGNKYISIIREPASQYESAFNYYKIASVVQTFNKSVRYEDTMEEFMRLPEFYWSKTVAKYGQLISFYTRNTQIYDLGLDHNTHHNISTVLSHINKLKKELDLVLLVDYFDESIVLLKKLLCWTWDDVVYLARNARPDGTRKELSMELRQKVIQWNSADHLLYQEFNRTLWAKVAEYGPQFKDDLEELRFRRNKTETECVGKNKTIVLDGRKQVVYNNVINPPNYCYLLTKFNNDIIHQIMEKQSSGFYLNNTSGIYTYLYIKRILCTAVIWAIAYVLPPPHGFWIIHKIILRP
ncbi:galactose-3-O-sulfotransferase 3-like [Saccoglossus kowalevskii]